MISGIEFWVNDKGRVRLFSVAEPDKITAQRLLQKRLPGIEFTTWQPLSSGVIAMLKLQKGEVIEWSPHRQEAQR
jgi:hypothetical protein